MSNEKDELRRSFLVRAIPLEVSVYQDHSFVKLRNLFRNRGSGGFNGIIIIDLKISLIIDFVFSFRYS
jgi:hypothetical protein